MSERKHGASPEAVKAGHETVEVSSRPLTVFLTGLAIGCVVVFILMLGLFKLFEKMENNANAPLTELEKGDAGRLPPEPRLQVMPQEHYDAYMAEMDSVLTGYGWVSRDSGLVRIPVENAIHILAEEGLPAREGRTIEPSLRMKPPAVEVEPVPDHGAAAGDAGGEHH